MNRITSLTFVFLLASLLAACSGNEPSIPVTGGEASALQLEVASPNGESALQQGDQAITYNYVVTNTGPQSLSGPVMVNDAPRQVFCPQLNTVGNLDSDLDFNESVTCTALYTPSEADLSAGSITSRAMAMVGGVSSNESTFTLGQAAVMPTTEGETGSLAPSPAPSAISTVTQGASGDSTATSSVSAAGTQGASGNTTETPSVIPTATEGAFADTTQTPSVIPTATSGASADVPQGPTASIDAVNVIDLPAGIDTIILPGIVPPGGTIRYSINAAQGQQLSLNFIVTTNQLAVAVSSPDGTVVKSREAALPWSASLSTSGDYLIEIVNADSAAAQPYVLELRRSPPN
jgi:hypothetical protein